MQRLLALITVLAAFSTPVAAQPPGLVVSVAASVYDALDEIAGLYRAATGVTVALNAGGSNTLARQIVEGAKAGLFLSADESADGCRGEGGPRRRRHAHAPSHQRACRHRSRGPPADFTLARLLEGRIARLAMGEPGGGARRRLRPHAGSSIEGAWAASESKVIPFPDRARGAVGG